MAHAQTYTDLYNFAGSSAGDGAGPVGSLTAVGPILYGMTRNGGNSQNQGTIFSFNTLTSSETVLHTFAGFPSDGGIPTGSLLQSGSIFYGLTSAAGADSGGTLFTFDPATNVETTQYSFTGAGGTNPAGSLIQSGTTLYGTTADGFTGAGGGVFAFDTTTNVENPLYTFGPAPDGGTPRDTLVQSGSTLYGMTLFGGSDKAGVIFAYDLATHSENIVHSFDGLPTPTNGGSPYGSLTLSGSTLYGMTAFGGSSGNGTIFGYDINTDIFKVLLSFNGSNGDGPHGDLLVDGDVLYGMTATNIFTFDTTTDTETILHTFDGSHGDSPSGDLTMVGSVLYGMTELGGNNGDGVIFSITVPEPATFSLLALFSGAVCLRRRR